MAAYAAFKHVELYNVGKTKKRVLRPPGGGSSDIFGVDLPQTPRSAKNHMQSHIFASDKNGAVKNNGDQPRRAQKNVDSYSRLFGEPHRPNNPARNHMKSSIPFGKNTEDNNGSAQLLANGNGHYHHYNDNNGSVSSTSSSVSSSTENLKMNGIHKVELDDGCPQSDTATESSSVRTEPLDIDLPCDEKSHSARSKRSEKPEIGSGDVATNTRRDSGCNPDHPNSLTRMSPPSDKKEPLAPCNERQSSTPTRNPITGLGLGEDGVGGIKQKKPKDRRDGNPVTGEGYKSGNDLNSSAPCLNGANQVINKNRIPPGGFSSGLW